MKNLTNFNLFNESFEYDFGSEPKNIINKGGTQMEIEGLRKKVNQKYLTLLDEMIEKIERSRQGGNAKASDLLTILETFNLLCRGEKKPEEVLAIGGILSRLYPGFNDRDSQFYNNERSQYPSDRLFSILRRNLNDYKETLGRNSRT